MATDQKVGGSSPPGRATPLLFTLFAAAAVLAAVTLPGRAAEMRISPGLNPDAPQLLVDGASPGDTVWVAPGTYGPLRLASGVRLIAETGPSETVFRGEGSFAIDVRADSGVVIEGITADGSGQAEGGIRVSESGVAIRGCVLTAAWSGVRAIHATVIVEDCTISACRNGIYLYESGGTIRRNEVSSCAQGMTIVSSSPRVTGNSIHGNTLGIVVAGHANPRLGGGRALANRIVDNEGGAIRNTAFTRRANLRDMQPQVVRATHNFWGSDCPDRRIFRGPVEFAPWVDASGRRVLSDCGGGARAR